MEFEKSGPNWKRIKKLRQAVLAIFKGSNRKATSDAQRIAQLKLQGYVVILGNALIDRKSESS